MTEHEFKIALLHYEIEASGWWVGLISNPFLQRQVSKYFARKVERKYARLKRGEKARQKLAELKTI